MRSNTFSEQTFRLILSKHDAYKNINIFVETGTWEGYQTKIATNCFPTVYGIELNDENARKTKAAVPQATIIHGDSLKELPAIFEKYKNTPLFIYLDAHFMPVRGQKRVPLPLWNELKLVKERNMPDIVVVDDTHCFGRLRNDLKANVSISEWEDITKESLLSFLGATCPLACSTSPDLGFWTGGQVVDSFETLRSFIIYLKKNDS